MGISTHILDTSLGRPAVGVQITLSLMSGEAWALISESATDSDGRCKLLLPAEHLLQKGIYRIRFDTGHYYERHHLAGLYPYIEIVFTVASTDQNYHIPLLLTANSYSTYRGS